VNYDPNNKGVLFKNDQGDNPKRPNYRGSAVIEGVDYNVSAWIRESKKSGDKYMSLVFERKGEGKIGRNGQPAKPTPAAITEDNWATADFDDKAVPF
jgi:hypothetical protein